MFPSPPSLDMNFLRNLTESQLTSTGGHNLQVQANKQTTNPAVKKIAPDTVSQYTWTGKTDTEAKLARAQLGLNYKNPKNPKEASPYPDTAPYQC
jgi:hypothetical protein